MRFRSLVSPFLIILLGLEQGKVYKEQQESRKEDLEGPHTQGTAKGEKIGRNPKIFENEVTLVQGRNIEEGRRRS